MGILHQKDFYIGTGISPKPLNALMKEPIFVPPTVKIRDLLKVLQKHKSHIAVVSDEYGGTLGIVTMEDILEELVGEIWDEHDEIVEDFQPTGEHSCKVLGTADLDELAERFDLEIPSECTSVSGWVMEELGRIPDEGDSFDYENLHVTVTATDGHRVVAVEIKAEPKPEEQSDKAHAKEN